MYTPGVISVRNRTEPPPELGQHNGDFLTAP
jgi:hypothetical protein